LVQAPGLVSGATFARKNLASYGGYGEDEVLAGAARPTFTPARNLLLRYFGFFLGLGFGYRRTQVRVRLTASPFALANSGIPPTNEAPYFVHHPFGGFDARAPRLPRSGAYTKNPLQTASEKAC